MQAGIVTVQKRIRYADPYTTAQYERSDPIPRHPSTQTIIGCPRFNVTCLPETSNPIQTAAIFGVKKGFSGSAVDAGNPSLQTGGWDGLA